MIFFKKKKGLLNEMLRIVENIENLLNEENNYSILVEKTEKLKELTQRGYKDLEKLKNEEFVKIEVLTQTKKVNLLKKQFQSLEELFEKMSTLLNSKIIYNNNKDQVKSILNDKEYSIITTIKEGLKILEQEIKDINLDLNTIIKYLNNENIEGSTFYGRFIFSQNYILDLNTGFVWDRDFSKRNKMSWDDAMNKAENEGKILPSREELKNLISSNKKYPSTSELEKIGFKNVLKEYYWTRDKSGQNIAWRVNFDQNQDAYMGKENQYNVLFVEQHRF